MVLTNIQVTWRLNLWILVHLVVVNPFIMGATKSALIFLNIQKQKAFRASSLDFQITK